MGPFLYAFFVYNSTEYSSTTFQLDALVYGRILEISIKLRAEPEPRYNYVNYIYDLKQYLQESNQIARENNNNN